MIEFCSKKRMVFAIAVLAGLSFLIIILESSQLRSHQEEIQDIHETHPVLKEKLRPEDKCWTKEKYMVMEECDVCTQDEVTNHKPVVCAVAKSIISLSIEKVFTIFLRLQRKGEMWLRYWGVQILW